MVSLLSCVLVVKHSILGYNLFMAKVTFLDIPSGFDFSYSKALRVNDRFTFSSIRLNNVFLSRRRKNGLSQKTLLPQCSSIWKIFDSATMDLWNSAGAVMNLSGFKFFVADYVLRMQNGMSGVSTPSLLYQTLVGKLTIASPATSFLLTQLHPLTYWISSPVYGKKGMRQPVLVTENFALPLQISISYKTSLSGAGDSPRARFFAIVYSLYQGQTIENVLEIPFTFSSGWTSATATLSSVKGLIKSYDLFIELYHVTGTLYIDNVKSVHSGLNWARDSVCRDIDQSFTKVFYQVPKNWVPVTISEGCFFGSVYYNAE